MSDDSKAKANPVEPLVPNAETIAAMQEARRGGLKHHRSVRDLLKALNADN